jgi:glycosyltransferase involved in cell wall biosynthesis
MMSNIKRDKKIQEGNINISKSDNLLPLITVAVPVYNSEKTLKKCLDSIVSQTYSNLDILLVNDGATDLSTEICENYRIEDPRIRVFYKPNGGVGSSRNMLLSLIIGEYTTFVDNDDWIDNDHVEKLYDQLVKHDADIAVCNFYTFDEREGVFQLHGNDRKYFERNFTSEEWFSKQYDWHDYMSQCFTVPWGKLYKSYLLDGLSFPENKVVEDDYTTYLIYLKASKISYAQRYTYVHRDSSRRITKKANLVDIFPLKSIEERLTLLAILGYDLSDEIAAYQVRLKIHQKEHLKNGNIVEYKRISKKIELIQEFKNKSYS